MLRSMTGFGRAEASGAASGVTVEVRSVNNRYLNLKLKVPQRYQRFEPEFEELVRGSVARGTIELSIRAARRAAAAKPVIDGEVARAYLSSIEELGRATALGGIDLRTLLLLPGVVALEESDEVAEAEHSAIAAAVTEALERMVEMRGDEGSRLAATLAEILADAERAAAAIAERADRVPAEYKARLEQRLARLIEERRETLDAGVLEREVALLADRADVAEELARLQSHFEAVRKALARTEPVGRSLDFVVQELAREANTIGSKAQDAAIGRSVIELKTAIERLREQVQNIE